MSGTVGTTKDLPPGRYGISGLLRSEWTKLRSLRSTMWTLGITVVLGIGISALATAETRAHWSSMSIGDRLSFDPTSTSLIGVFVGQLTIGVLGVLVMSGEYGSGTIRATFSAAPRRPLVLVAKAAVFGLVALVAAEIVSFLSYFLGQALLTAPATHTTLGSPGALRAVAGSGIYLCLIGLCALGLAHGGGDQRFPRDPPSGPDHRPRASHLARERDREIHARSHRSDRRLSPHGAVLPSALDRPCRALRLRGGASRHRRSAARPARRVSRSDRTL